MAKGVKQSEAQRRDKYLQGKYGISNDRYMEMFDHGHGLCWICHRPPKQGKRLNVDHEHLTREQRKLGQKFGKVRGLLDYRCNKYLVGRYRTEHADLFETAAAYLKSTKDWRL